MSFHVDDRRPSVQPGALFGSKLHNRITKVIVGYALIVSALIVGSAMARSHDGSASVKTTTLVSTAQD